MFSFPLQLLSATILILRINERDMIKKCKLVFMSDFNATWIFSNLFSKNPQISSLMKIRPVGAELFHADGRTDG